MNIEAMVELARSTGLEHFAVSVVFHRVPKGWSCCVRDGKQAHDVVPSSATHGWFFGQTPELAATAMVGHMRDMVKHAEDTSARELSSKAAIRQEAERLLREMGEAKP